MLRFSSFKAKAGLLAVSLSVAIAFLHPGIWYAHAAKASDEEGDADPTAKLPIDKVSEDDPYWKQFVDKVGLSSKSDEEKNAAATARELFPGQTRFPSASPSSSPSKSPSPSSPPSESFAPSVSSVPSSSPSASLMPSESANPSSSPSVSPICVECGISLRNGTITESGKTPSREAADLLKQTRFETYCNLVTGFCPRLINDTSVCVLQGRRCDGPDYCIKVKEDPIDEDSDNVCKFACEKYEYDCPDDPSKTCTGCIPNHPLEQCRPDNYIPDEWKDQLKEIDDNIEDLERRACGEEKQLACSPMEDGGAEAETCPFECVTDMPTTQPSSAPSTTPVTSSLTNRIDKIPRVPGGANDDDNELTRGKLAIASNGRKDSLNYLNQFQVVNLYEYLIALFESFRDGVPDCGGLGGDFTGFVGIACKAVSTALALAFNNVARVFINLHYAATRRLTITDYENKAILFDYQQMNYDNGQYANEKLNEVLCPYGTEGPKFVRQGQGCDGVDQNCDCIVDDCSEDKVPITITLEFRAGSKRRLTSTTRASLSSIVADDVEQGPSIGDIAGDPLAVSIPFPSFEEGEQFLVDNVQVSDDCALELQKKVTFVEEGGDSLGRDDCRLCEFEVTATDSACLGQTEAAEVTQNYILEIDREPATIECGFFTPQNRWHVHPEDFPDFDPYLCNETAPFPTAGDILHVDRDDFYGSDMINVNFWYNITNPNFIAPDPIDVTVTLTSNEVEFDIKSSGPVDELTEMGRIVESSYIKPDSVQRARIYLSPTTCHDKYGEPGICDIDEPDSETRVYEIKIETEDISGNKAEASCNVIVIPDCHYRNETSKSSRSNKSYYGDGSDYTSKSSKSSDDEEDEDDGDESDSTSKSSSKSSSKSCHPHDPNDLRDWLNSASCSPRNVIGRLEYKWDPTLEDTIKVPEPEPPCKSKSSKSTDGSRSSSSSKSSKSCCPDKGKGKGSCSKGSKSPKGCYDDYWGSSYSDSSYSEDWEEDVEEDVAIVVSSVEDASVRTDKKGTSKKLKEDAKSNKYSNEDAIIHTDKKGTSKEDKRPIIRSDIDPTASLRLGDISIHSDENSDTSSKKAKSEKSRRTLF